MMQHNMQIKYEYSDITTMLNTLNLFHSKYKIVRSIKVTTKKGVYVVETPDKNKYIMKVKLRDFVTDSEIDIHKKLYECDHPNIIKILHICKSKQFFIVIYEYLEGFDMYNTKYYHLYENNIVDMFKNVLLAISFLHGINICHNDIKPNNIMITKINGKYTPVIIDFDLSFTCNLGACNTLKRNKDILNVAMTFYYYFFHDDMNRTQKVNLELIENYVGEHTKFINLLGWILNHSYEICPSINEILTKIE